MTATYNYKPDSKIDWNKVEKDYVQGIIDSNGRRVYPSQEDLSKLYALKSPTSLSNRSVRHGWQAKRKAFQTSERAKTAGLVVNAVAEGAQKVATLTINADTSLLLLLNRYLKPIMAMANENDEELKKNPKAKMVQPISPDEMYKIARVLQVAQAVALDSLGLPSQTNSLIRRDISNSKTELEESVKKLPLADIKLIGEIARRAKENLNRPKDTAEAGPKV